ncbi:MAG TPA: acyltransferase [Actinomycetota bacterium]|nr:acyltransferase [Actinomycetota bacterium]
MSAGLGETVAGMAAATPPDRDRYVDFLRAFSIATVVLGHWFIAIVVWRDEYIKVVNVVGVTRGLWLLTWVLQVMPLFFFVGGFSNAKTYESMRRRGHGYGEFMRSRMARLWRPTLVFVAVWTVVEVLLHVFDVGRGGLLRGTFLPFGPLWFLLVYAGVVAATPLMLRLHRLGGIVVVTVLTALVALADVARFALEVPGVGWANLALVWLLVHQAGFFYEDGTLVAAGPRAHVSMAIAGLAGLIALTNLGVYPRSMVGTDVERLSNMNPPTLCIVALACWLIGLAMLLRERANRWLQKPRPWQAVVAANGMIMTVFLWHLTGYLVTILALHPLGLGRSLDSTPEWWLERPVWLLVPVIPLALLVALFGRFERGAR